MGENAGGPFNIRPVNAADEAGWHGLWQGYCDFFQVTIPPDVTVMLWQRIMDYRTPIHALVAETPLNDGNAELIGFANYVLHPFTWGTDLICYLEDLFVAEHARGAGAGRALINELTRFAEENGWPRVYWHTHELNGARKLYDSITPVDPFVRYVVKIR
jgi:GNAT superfamily N-acetyltransferase